MRIRLIISVSLLSLLILPFVIKIKHVYCTSQFGKCSPHIEDQVNQLVGISYKQVDTKISTIDSLKNDIENYRYYYVPLNSLNINVIEKKGEVAYLIQNTPRYKIYSKDLSLIADSEDTQLPVVYIDTEDQLKLESFEFVTDLMINLSRYYSIKEAIWSKNSFSIIYNDSTEIIFPTEGDIDVLLGSLEVMLFQLNQALQNSKIDNISAEQISTIDLRYKNPIIK